MYNHSTKFVVKRQQMQSLVANTLTLYKPKIHINEQKKNTFYISSLLNMNAVLLKIMYGD
nr:hypothetical protein Itr_chr12CG26150 [Ipomoea trifida]